MKPLAHLKQLWLEDKIANNPDRAPHTFGSMNTWNTAKPETKELKRIKALIELCGGIAAITNSSAVRIDNRKSYVDSVGFHRTVGSVEFRKNHNLQVGHSDMTATWKSESLFIELKRIYKKGKDRQSEAQKQFEMKVTQSGATYIITHSFEHFYEWALQNKYLDDV